MRPASNTIETYKDSKGGDGLRIREDLSRLIAQGHEALTPAEKDLLKWLGIFFRKPTPGQFMMRIRMPNGFATSAQLGAVAELSRRLGNSVLDITTRQQVELRGFVLGSVPEIWERLRGVNLTSLQTGMDNVRNINGCPLAGLTPAELFDAVPVVFELDRILVGPEGNPEFTNLPRKFNVTVTGCLENCTHNESQDIALVPARRDERDGFHVLVGGKMGSGGFTVASPLDVFVEPDRGGHAFIDGDGYIAGSPELAAEVSASTTRLDLRTKFKVYRRNEIREYLIWHVARKTLDWYVVRNGRYQALPPSRAGFLQSEIFPGLWLDAKALIRGDLVRVHEVLRQGLQSPEHAQFATRLQAAES